MGLSQAGKVTVHAVLAGHLCALGKVVHFLMPSQALVNLHLNIGRGPADRPFVVSFRSLAEAVVLQRVAQQRNRHTVVKFEIVALVRGQVRSDRHGVDVGAEDEELLLHNVVDCGFGS